MKRFKKFSKKELSNLGINFCHKISKKFKSLVGEEKPLISKKDFKNIKGNSYEHAVIIPQLENEALIELADIYLKNIKHESRYNLSKFGYEGTLIQRIVPVLLDRLEEKETEKSLILKKINKEFS